MNCKAGVDGKMVAEATQMFLAHIGSKWISFKPSAVFPQVKRIKNIGLLKVKAEFILVARRIAHQYLIEQKPGVFVFGTPALSRLEFFHGIVKISRGQMLLNTH